MRWQAEKLAELERGLNRLREEFRAEVRALAERPPVHVEKIEYSFDQLKIESLEGTLHIGVTPPGAGERTIGEFLVQDRPIDLSDPDIYAALEEIRDELDRYLASDFREEIRRMEAEYRLILGEHYRDAIVLDLRSQVLRRADHYVRQVAAKRMAGQGAARAGVQQSEPPQAGSHQSREDPAQGIPPGAVPSREIPVHKISDRVKEDVRAAVRRHLELLSRRREERGNPE